MENDKALQTEVAAYIEGVLERLRAPSDSDPHPTALGEGELAITIFNILTSREFCYLGKKRVEVYRDTVIEMVRRRMSRFEPFRFFYDIGPGYHATTRPGILPLRFEMGLSELLILSQVNALSQRIASFYTPGVRFWLVIDNLCALRTNDISLENTSAYVAKLRDLIDEVGLGGTVELIVEAESFDLSEYDRLLGDRESGPRIADPSPAAVENVARFLGRPCTPDEAAERIERYSRTGSVTDELIDRLVQGVHMTQRATGATLGFRPFPGGDQRTQAGELVLTRGKRGQLRPILVTSRNVDDYVLTQFELPGTLPRSIAQVTYAEPRLAIDTS